MCATKFISCYLISKQNINGLPLAIYHLDIQPYIYIYIWRAKPVIRPTHRHGQSKIVLVLRMASDFDCVSFRPLIFRHVSSKAQWVKQLGLRNCPWRFFTPVNDVRN